MIRPVARVGGLMILGLVVLAAADRVDLAAINGQHPTVLTPGADGAAIDTRLRSCAGFYEPLLPDHPAVAGDAVADAAMVPLCATGIHDPVPWCDAVDAYLAAYPASRWRCTLRVNQGIALRGLGFVHRPSAAWRDAWSRPVAGVAAAIHDRAGAELAWLAAWAGQYEEVDDLLRELSARPLRGQAATRTLAAQNWRAFVEQEPVKVFKSGPYATAWIVAEARGETFSAISPIIRSTYHIDNGYVTNVDPAHLDEATRRGASMLEVRDHLRVLGEDYQIARRGPGAPLILPAMVLWRIGHYSAVIRQRDDGRVLVRDTNTDPLPGFDHWMVPAALDADASDVYIIPNQPLPQGWSPVDDRNVEQLYGR